MDINRRREGLSLKQIVNTLLREALRNGQEAPRAKKHRTRPQHIAAYAIEHAGTVYTNDRDFGRFAGVRWKNPLQ